jgi:hypothetical protein
MDYKLAVKLIRELIDDYHVYLGCLGEKRDQVENTYAGGILNAISIIAYSEHLKESED